MLIILFLVLFFGLLAVGMPIFLVLGLCAAVLYFASGEPLIGVAQVIIDHLNSPTLMSLPLFVMAASPRRWWTFPPPGSVASAVRSGLSRSSPARCLRRSPALRSRPRSRWE